LSFRSNTIDYLLTNNWFKFPNFLNQYAVIGSKLVAIQSSIENQDKK